MPSLTTARIRSWLATVESSESLSSSSIEWGSHPLVKQTDMAANLSRVHRILETRARESFAERTMADQVADAADAANAQ